MYLPSRHNKVANIITPKRKNKCRQPIRKFYSKKYFEIWWDTLTPHKQNKPDIVLWGKVEKKCFIIDKYVGLDLNVIKNLN